MNGRTATSKIIAVIVTAIAVGVAGADAASAASYCVTPATGCDVNSIPDVQTALNDAGGDTTGSDVVRLGAATYPDNSLSYSGAVPVTLQGLSTSQTMVVPSAGTSFLVVSSGAAFAVQNMSITSRPSGNWVGVLDSSGPLNVSHVTFTTTGSPTSVVALHLTNGGSVTNSSITVPGASNSVGILSSGSAAATAADDVITGFTGLKVDGGGSAFAAHRVTLMPSGTGAVAMIVNNAGTSAAIDESLVRLGANSTGLWSNNSTATLTARQVTVVGDGGAGERAVLDYGTLNLYDSIARNLTQSLVLIGASTSVSTDYDDFAGATDVTDSHIQLSGGATSANVTLGAHNIDADPLFVGASDFHLTSTSPALHRDPTAIQASESTTDLDGLPRFGIAGGRDMGAFQHQPPSASASASPPSAPVGTAFTFTGSGTDTDPGDTLTYHWAFDDGASASTATAMHAFATAGTHTGTLTVTDATGLTATATATVTVTAVVVPPPPPPPVPDLENFTLTNRTFAIGGPATPISGALKAAVTRGTTFSFQINTTANVTLSFALVLPGRRAGHSCLAPRQRRRGRHDTPCTRYIGMGHINRWAPSAGSYSIPFSGRVGGSSALGVGKYHAILSAKNVTGAATPRNVSFTVVAAAKKPVKKRRHH